MLAALTPVSDLNALSVAGLGLGLASPSASLARLGLLSPADPVVGQLALLNSFLLQQLAMLMQGRADLSRPDTLGERSSPVGGLSRLAPDGSAVSSASSSASPGPAGSGTQVAQEIAQEMAGYKYQFYYNDRKSEAETERSRSGNCKDLADVAIAKFRQRGVQARLVHGNITSKTYSGGHYWVEYQDPSGNWRFFDPTGAASNRSAQRAFQGLRASYRKG